MAVLPTGIGPVTGYNIERSLRFNSADSAYLNRTFGTPTNNTTWTLSLWLKRSLLTNGSTVFGIFGESTGYAGIYFSTEDKIRMFDNAGSQASITTAVFRDPSAHGHLVVRSNGTNIKTYWNNVEVASYTGTISLLNASGGTMQLGRYSNAYFNGYMSEVYFVDGSALTPSDFGETDSATGVWKPKAYTGTYGTNGFFLKFADNSGTTSTTLGKDSSGNGNNWTPNNFSVTAGAGNDSLVDSPTAYGTDTGVGGEVRGNYCTLNPLTKPSSATISNGNLDTTLSTSSGSRSVASTFYQDTGSWYWEAVATTVGNNSAGIGIANTSFVVGNEGGTGCYFYLSDGRKVINNTYSSYGASWIANDVIGVAFDATNGTITFYKNGSSQGQITGIPTGVLYTPFVCSNTSVTASVFVNNFGQRAFAYTAPSGFKALCTQNLPTPTIGATSTTQANDYFDILLETGTGSARSVTGLNFQPDFLWAKGRSSSSGHLLYDVVRGVDKSLATNTTAAEDTTAGQLTSFNSNGYSLPNDTSGYLNFSGRTYAFWNWKANGAGSSNTAGTITSTVSANTTAGFSIVSFTNVPVNASTYTIGHGLGVAPKFYIVKNRDIADDWYCYHASLGASARISLNTTAAAVTPAGIWGSTAPTSSVFSLVGNAMVTVTTQRLIAYCFSEIAGYSAFGSYTGNGSADGPFVFTNFRPKYLLFKRTDSTSQWRIYDSVRSTYNEAKNALYANLSDAEAVDSPIDFLSNGFKIRTTDTAYNASGGTYIYMAFAENPFKYSLAR